VGVRVRPSCADFSPWSRKEQAITTDITRPVVVVITGLPASGKTTVARALAPALGLPLFSLDAIKEALYDAPGGAERSRAELRFAAEAVLAALVADSSCGAVLDIWLDPARADRDRLREGLPAALPLREVVCDVSADVAVQRYESRARHAAHLAPDPGVVRQIRLAAELNALAPLDARQGLGPVIHVDTMRPVDVVALVQALTG
jgi:predicted kinase